MREIFRCVSVAALVVTLAVLMPAASIAGQEQDQESANPLQEWERAELQTLARTVGDALQGRLAPTENPFELQPSFFRQVDGLTYVPFTVTVDPAQINRAKVAMYLYVTAHQDPPAAPAAPADPDTAEEPVPQMPKAVFEAAYFIDVSAQRAGGGPIHLSRAFAAPGGDYDVYIAMRDSLGGPAPEDEESASVLMIREEVSVPNLWTPELQTSSVLMADLVEPLTEPLAPDMQTEEPYTMGTTRIVPKYGRSFGKQDELSLLLLVYNAQPTGDQKPDLTIEYNFHQRTDAGEEFFNKTNPQQFNAQTLPPGFDLAQGHQIFAGQSVPLSMFPAGDYRLEITISDNEAGASVTRDVHFTVQEI